MPDGFMPRTTKNFLILKSFFPILSQYGVYTCEIVTIFT